MGALIRNCVLNRGVTNILEYTLIRGGALNR